MTDLTVLKQIEELKEVEERSLLWLLDRSKITELKAQDYLFVPEDPLDHLFIILKGSLIFSREKGARIGLRTELKQGSISGLLPYSRATKGYVYAEAFVESRILQLHKSNFEEMIKEHHDLTSVFVHVMSTRIRTFTKFEQQNEKMMALGKLSAGLAHELNNPSAAVVRSAKELSRHLRNMPKDFKKLMEISMTEEQIDFVNKSIEKHLESGIQTYSMLERNEIVDELTDWLDDQEFEDADELAENIVDYGFTANDLDEFKSQMSEEDLLGVVNWIHQSLATDKLVHEISDASERINHLVGSIKSYTHMDRVNEKQLLDLHNGINNTLTMLNHKVKKSNVEIVREYEEGLKATVLPSEINQVWTNLIDNALDAMESNEGAVLKIRSYKKDEFANVIIEDNGSGIPDDVKDKIFDPFFTTKEIGQGTGLGLELVQQIIRDQHHGQIYVESEPGKTQFRVCIPIEN